MCDKELLLGYLYGELGGAEREEFDRHLKSCGDCRSEADALRGTRNTLQAWTPPEPDLSFQVVRASQRLTSKNRWALSPAWGLAAAAVFVGAVSAAIANVEVTVDASGVTVRTGWNQTGHVAARIADAPAQTDLRRELAAMAARLERAEGLLAEQSKAAVPASAAGAPPQSRMTDAEIARFVRHMINQSEDRQQSVLARQILQMNRDLENARRTDLDRLGRGMFEIQRTAVETFQRQRALEEHLYRVGFQR